MGLTSPEEALATVRGHYELMAVGKIDEASQFLADDVVVRESPALPYGGDHHGVKGVLDLMASMNEVVNLSVVRLGFIGVSNPVVVQLVARFASKTSEERVDMDVIELNYVHDGKITEIDVYYKDPGAVAALWPPRRATAPTA